MIAWATQHIKKLQNGETVSFRPFGRSMEPKILSGQEVTVSPDITNLKKNDIVLCNVEGKQYLHLISDVKGETYQISNNKGHINGWIPAARIYGRLIRVAS